MASGLPGRLPAMSALSPLLGRTMMRLRLEEAHTGFETAAGAPGGDEKSDRRPSLVGVDESRCLDPPDDAKIAAHMAMVQAHANTSINMQQ